jgi:hypothetical protein
VKVRQSHGFTFRTPLRAFTPSAPSPRTLAIFFRAVTPPRAVSPYPRSHRAAGLTSHIEFPSPPSTRRRLPHRPCLPGSVCPVPWVVRMRAQSPPSAPPSPLSFLPSAPLPPLPSPPQPALPPPPVSFSEALACRSRLQWTPPRRLHRRRGRRRRWSVQGARLPHLLPLRPPPQPQPLG